MTTNPIRRLALLGAILLGLSACGGSSSGATAPTLPTLNETSAGAEPTGTTAPTAVDPEEAFQEYAACMREHGIDAQAVIVFTDGYIYGGWGQWDVPVLWTVFNNKGCKPTVGKVCHINASRR